jgi:hypothetical protein
LFPLKVIVQQKLKWAKSYQLTGTFCSSVGALDIFLKFKIATISDFRKKHFAPTGAQIIGEV